MKDRVVQYPNRYKLVPVPESDDTFDFEAVPGTVTQEGTFLNKANLLTDETAARFGLTDDPTVDDAFSMAAVKPAYFSATLLATAWTGSAAPYTQTVTVTGLLSTDRPIADVALTGTASTDTAILEAWGLVSRITTADGSITAVCYEDKPEVDIPIQMEVIR